MNEQEVLQRQVAEWRAEVDRLNGLIAHATSAQPVSGALDEREAFQGWHTRYTTGLRAYSEFNQIEQEAAWKAWQARAALSSAPSEPKAQPTPTGFMQPMPNPTATDLADQVFNAIWNATKTWDVNVPEFYSGYCGLNGSHVMLILNAIRALPPAQPEKGEDAELLDWLDELNRKTNERNGTVYGWKFDINHNRAALTDHNFPALSIRQALRAAIAASQSTAETKP